ncbi:MAG: FAD-dependent oxidoreductase [Rhodanobacteraceae bacterium]
MTSHAYPRYGCRRLDACLAGEPLRHPVVIVGAGPCGLVLAIDLAQHGVPTIVLDEEDTVSTGSRAICFAKRTLEVLDRIGVGEQCVCKGAVWNVGRTFFRDDEVYHFDLQPRHDQHRPGMVNLQQYYLEEYLIERANAVPGLDLRFGHRLVGLRPENDGVSLDIETPEGPYTMSADWVVAADGCRSTIRHALGLNTQSDIVEAHFLIADVTMQADFPSERWFWFNAPFHDGQSVLLHHQPDNVWRIDFQLGWDADPEVECRPENVTRRIHAMLGKDHPFELEWVSVYTFQSRRMEKFRHGRVLFVGDAAHQVSPFGARGANSGIQDAWNLSWKLKLVLDRNAPERLLDTYSDERVFAADENIRVTTRTADFMTPASKASVTFRNAVLALARKYPFARALVNSGRLSVPVYLTDSALNTEDSGDFASDMGPGAPCDDVAVRTASGDAWLLDQLGRGFNVLTYVDGQLDDVDVATLRELADGSIPVDVVAISQTSAASGRGVKVLHDHAGQFRARYDARPGSTWLVRPDQYLAGRWREVDAVAVRAALSRATCNVLSARRPVAATATAS